MKIFFNNLFRRIFGEINYMDFTSRISYIKQLQQYYNDKNNEIRAGKKLYYMADGKIIHGGIGDRIFGMVALYTFCKHENINYKIYFESPFCLSDYLEPNDYDWVADKKEVCYNSNISRAVIVKNTRKDNYEYLKRKISPLSAYEQIHVYTNIQVVDENFSELFTELFKPSEPLANQIMFNKNNIPKNYISITFRFQQLLGDFQEGNYKVLAQKKKIRLVDKCLKAVERIKELNNIETILVTSDSNSFLNTVKAKYDYIYTIPGVVNHVDYTSSKETFAYMKSFVDLYMVAGAERVYSYCTGPMYRDSGFAKLASLIGNREYIKIVE